jgi:cephalosporin hydroxylase
VYSGGSLLMWRDYFGDESTIYGVDIQPECRMYEQPGIRIFIGDQADPEFWREFREQVPDVDIVIDDGGHTTRQQIVTLEALLPHIRAGGVYLCEDVHRATNPFHAYIDGLTRHVNSSSGQPPGANQQIESVHRYSSLVVIEKPQLPVPPFEFVRGGTEWQQFDV